MPRKAKAWTYTVGELPVQLTAHERPDRGNAIYTRVWDGLRVTRKERLCDSIRDERGKLDPDKQITAQKLANSRHAALVSGEEDDTKGPLTVKVGFRKLLHSRDGKFAADTAWKKQVKSFGDTIVGILGGTLLWSQVGHKHYRKVWRELAEQHAKEGKFGKRQAEKIVGQILATATWLQTEGLLEPGIALPAPKWKESLAADWVEITTNPIPEVKKPRYTAEEQVKLWSALPKADARVHLAVEIGAEARLGQVLRCRRSDIRPDVAGSIPKFVLIHGRGKKLGKRAGLTRQARAVLLHAMSEGYLRDLEAAYQRKEIADYFLFPAGKMKEGRARIENGKRSWNPDGGLGKAWDRLEELADVEAMDGRRWYGLRRLASDRAEDVESDARVLNDIGGWKHTATREHYQAQGRTDISERAVDVLEKIRPHTKAAD